VALFLISSRSALPGSRTGQAAKKETPCRVDWYGDGDIFAGYPYIKGNLHGPGKLCLRGGRRSRKAGGPMKNARSSRGRKGNREFPGRLDRPAWLLLLACVFLFASCATTKVTEAWKDDQYRGTIRKVVVLGIFEERDTRKIFEDEFADRLRARGVEAMASHKFISDAELPDKDVVIGKIKKREADTVIVTRLVDIETEQTTVSGRSYIVPKYYGYYGNYYTYIYKEGYTVEEGHAFTETNLYNVGDEKLIWSGRSKTNFSSGTGSRPIPRYELIQAFVKTLIDRFSDEKLIR